MATIQTVVTVTLNPAIDRVIEVPNFTLGAHQRGDQVMRYPAGKAINVSRALAMLGRRSVATGFIGRDELGLFETFLDDATGGRVVCQFLSVRGRTRENITLVDPVSEVETHIREAGFQISEEDRRRMISKIQLLARPDTLVVISGSIPPGLEDQGFMRIVQTCLEAGARVALDTNGSPLLAVRDLPVWLLKPNLQELGELVGRPIQGEAEIYEAAAELARTATVVIVTAGGEGAYVVTRRGHYRGRVAVHPGRVQNTVGCGDCLMAGFIDAWMAGKSLDACLHRGLATATANATQLALASFSLQDVAEFEALAKVEPWTPTT